MKFQSISNFLTFRKRVYLGSMHAHRPISRHDQSIHVTGIGEFLETFGLWIINCPLCLVEAIHANSGPWGFFHHSIEHGGSSKFPPAFSWNWRYSVPSPKAASQKMSSSNQSELNFIHNILPLSSAPQYRPCRA